MSEHIERLVHSIITDVAEIERRIPELGDREECDLEEARFRIEQLLTKYRHPILQEPVQ